MPRPRKKQPDLAAMADEVNDILHYLSKQGYTAEVGKIRNFLQEQGEFFVKASNFNRKLNNELSTRLVKAETLLDKHSISLDA